MGTDTTGIVVWETSGLETSGLVWETSGLEISSLSSDGDPVGQQSSLFLMSDLHFMAYDMQLMFSLLNHLFAILASNF